MTKLMIVGEAWGRDEEALGFPFVGASGALVFELLDLAGILTLTAADRANIREYWRSGHDSTSRNPYHNWLVWQAHPELFVTNVFNLRPRPTNDIKNLCGPKAEGIPGYPSLSQGKYVRKEYEPELERLFHEVTEQRPTLIIAFGGTPTWALLKASGITGLRGAPGLSHLGVKVLPTYHPAAILRDFSLRPVVIADLLKAKREAEFPEIRRPRRELWIEPSIEDLDFFDRTYMMGASCLAVDIETKGDMITCIGFAPSTDRALVVPFYDPSKPDKNYWATFNREKMAWEYVKYWCENFRTIFQNGLFDMHLLWRKMGIQCRYAEDDTMLLHHALQPELKKSLSFLGSVYTDEARWKLMRKTDTLKKED